MNPEFQRNLYLEFSFARLIGMPLFLLFIFSLSYLMNEQKFDEETASVAIWLYVFIVLFWGARQSAEAIFDELRNHTWDIQKTSAISPWSLTWGKLFGSTLFNWYGGILCLLVYIATCSEKKSIFIIIGYAIGSGLLVQSLSFLVSLFSLRKKQTFNSSVSYLFVLFILFFISGMVIGSESSAFKSIHWYSFEMEGQVFGLISLVFACGWSITGIYRLLAQELQIRTLPWVWLLFSGFLIIYSHGLIMGSTVENHRIQQNIFSSTHLLMLMTFGIGSCLTYSLILIDDNNPMLMRRLWIYAAEENWQRFLEEIPCWLISLLLIFPVSLYLTLSFPFETTEKLHFYPITVFLLMVRDIALVLFFNYAPNPKRALGLSILYLTFLYWIIPAIFMESGAESVAALFLPLLSGHFALSVIFAGGQAAFMGYLLFNRWQKTVNQLQSE